MAIESASGSATTGVGSSVPLHNREIVQTSRNQEVWKRLQHVHSGVYGHKKAQCKFCFHFFAVGSNTTLKNHISHPHCEVLKAQQNQNPEAGQTTMGRDGQVFMYNPDYLREQFAGLVIQRGLPFNHFDNEQTTRVFQNTMQPRYTHVSRSTLKRDAMKLWVAAKQATIDGFANLNTMVNLTTDIWSAPHNLPGSYMCVTAHWIEPSSWQMMKRVISFEEFSSELTFRNVRKCHQTQSTTAEGSSSQKSRDPLSRMVHGLTQHKQKKARGDPIMSSEYEQYIKTDFVRGLQPKDYESYDVLGFWKQGKISFLFYPAWPWIFKWSKLLR
ncbi:hypothetical protein Tco_0132840 [Tanacetum coccineum]